jgi:hypothetical protein
MAPIHRLSEDLLQVVLLEHVMEGYRVKERVANWIHLTQVCRSWHALIFGNGAFWDTIVSLKPAFIARMLALSKSALISVQVAAYGLFSEDPADAPPFATIIPLLAPHMGRVRALHLLPLTGKAHVDLISDVLGPSTPVPVHLEALSFGSSDERAHLQPLALVHHGMPHLRYLYTNMAMTWDHPALSESMRFFSLNNSSFFSGSFSIRDVLKGLRAMPRLDTLYLYASKAFVDRSYEELPTVHLSRLELCSVDLPVKPFGVFTRHVVLAQTARCVAKTEVFSLRNPEVMEDLCTQLQIHVRRACASTDIGGLRVTIALPEDGDIDLELLFVPASRQDFHEMSNFGEDECPLKIKVNRNNPNSSLNDVHALWTKMRLRSLSLHVERPQHAVPRLSSREWWDSFGAQTDIAVLDVGIHADGDSDAQLPVALETFIQACEEHLDLFPRLEHLYVPIAGLAPLIPRMTGIFGSRRRRLSLVYVRAAMYDWPPQAQDAQAQDDDQLRRQLAMCADCVEIRRRQARFVYNVSQSQASLAHELTCPCVRVCRACRT